MVLYLNKTPYLNWSCASDALLWGASNIGINP